MSQGLPEGTDTDRAPPQQWRSALLHVVLRVFLVLGIVTYVPSVAISLQTHLIGVAALDTVALVGIVFASFAKRFSDTVRAAVAVVVMYLLGGGLLVGVGSIGQAYLLGFSLLTTLLLGSRFGLAAVATSAVTMFGLGASGAIAPEIAGTPWSLAGWFVVTANFSFVSLMLVLALAYVITVLEKGLAREITARDALTREGYTLLSLNASLAQEIGERKRAQAQHEKLEMQLRQAQKMDAVGRLAGGVAHDFNNMLSVILLNGQLIFSSLEAADPRRLDMQELLLAAKRSAELTNQLLAFARQQPITPKVLDLGSSITPMLKMLRRLIGEDIVLVWSEGIERLHVTMDGAQLHQILANLMVNARDAIHGVGRITIEMSTRHFDAEFCAQNLGHTPGHFVCLTVTDSGCGMDQDTQSKLFEPFFTTKDLGQGTGLGLATVYGIVKQNGGFIGVYSEKGHGATFHIYLPRTRADAMTKVASNEGRASRGTETVLLVEDEEALLRLGKRLLESLGYTVLACSAPRRALEVADNYGRIDLLVSDVIMPEMTGREVWEHLHAKRPELKCLFTSGYTADVISHRGVLEPGVHFLQKPFTLEALAAKVREALTEV